MRPLCDCWCKIMAIHHRYDAERIIQSLWAATAASDVRDETISLRQHDLKIS